MEETVTVSVVYIEPNAAEPTQDSTKDFTPRVETATVRERSRDSTPRKPLRTEVSAYVHTQHDAQVCLFNAADVQTLREDDFSLTRSSLKLCAAPPPHL